MCTILTCWVIGSFQRLAHFICGISKSHVLLSPRIFTEKSFKVGKLLQAQGGGIEFLNLDLSTESSSFTIDLFIAFLKIFYNTAHSFHPIVDNVFRIPNPEQSEFVCLGF